MAKRLKKPEQLKVQNFELQFSFLNAAKELKNDTFTLAAADERSAVEMLEQYMKTQDVNPESVNVYKVTPLGGAPIQDPSAATDQDVAGEGEGEEDEDTEESEESEEEAAGESDQAPVVEEPKEESAAEPEKLPEWQANFDYLVEKEGGTTERRFSTDTVRAKDCFEAMDKISEALAKSTPGLKELGFGLVRQVDPTFPPHEWRPRPIREPKPAAPRPPKPEWLRHAVFCARVKKSAVTNDVKNKLRTLQIVLEVPNDAAADVQRRILDFRPDETVSITVTADQGTFEDVKPEQPAADPRQVTVEDHISQQEAQPQPAAQPEQPADSKTQLEATPEAEAEQQPEETETSETETSETETAPGETETPVCETVEGEAEEKPEEQPETVSPPVGGETDEGVNMDDEQFLGYKTVGGCTKLPEDSKMQAWGKNKKYFFSPTAKKFFVQFMQNEAVFELVFIGRPKQEAVNQ